MGAVRVDASLSYNPGARRRLGDHRGDRRDRGAVDGAAARQRLVHVHRVPDRGRGGQRHALHGDGRGTCAGRPGPGGEHRGYRQRVGFPAAAHHRPGQSRVHLLRGDRAVADGGRDRRGERADGADRPEPAGTEPGGAVRVPGPGGPGVPERDRAGPLNGQGYSNGQGHEPGEEEPGSLFRPRRPSAPSDQPLSQSAPRSRRQRRTLRASQERRAPGGWKKGGRGPGPGHFPARPRRATAARRLSPCSGAGRCGGGRPGSRAARTSARRARAR